MTGLGLGVSNPVRNGGVLDLCMWFGLWWCRLGVGRCLEPGLEEWGGVMVVSLDNLCIW